jgi:hypothetical protein
VFQVRVGAFTEAKIALAGKAYGNVLLMYSLYLKKVKL